jgi:hypothetical protein
MECYRVHIPDGVKIPGATAAGRPCAVLPGEYLAHRLRPKGAPASTAMLRFIGADASGHDVHVSLDAVRKYLDRGVRLTALREREQELRQRSA